MTAVSGEAGLCEISLEVRSAEIVLKNSNQPKSPQNVGTSFFQIAFKQTALPK